MVKRLLLVLLMFASSAFADAPTTWFYITGYSWFPTKPYSTADALCSAFVTARNAADPSTISVCSSRAQGPTYIYTDRTNVSNGAVSYNIQYNISSVSRCSDGSAPDTSKPLNEQCAPEVCPYGEIKMNGVCEPIVCPAGQHFGRDPYNTALEIHRCVEDCPVNTISNIDAVTHIQVCAPEGPIPPNESDSPTCAPGQVQVGFTGSGNAICMNPPDNPCPQGTHNIGTNAEPNCAGDKPSEESTTSETKHPEETTNNPDGSTTKTNKTETTYPDGSKLTTTTKTTTNSDGTTTTQVTTQCSKQGACGGTATGGSGNGSGNGTGDGEGDDDSGNPAPLDGDLYTKKDDTFASVMQTFRDTVQAAPVVSAATNFLSVSVGGAGCPSWSVSVPYLNVVADVGQYFCSGLMTSVFGIIAAGLMLGASYVAFRWAFL